MAKIKVDKEYLVDQGKVLRHTNLKILNLSGNLKRNWPIIRNKYKIVLVTWGGRRRYLNVLLPYVLKLREYVDEWRIFMNTDWQPDIDYINEIEEQYLKYNFIKVIKKRVIKNNINCFNQYYEDLNDPDTIYVKIDDDIMYIDTEKFQDFIVFRVRNLKYFFVFANIINCANLYDKQKLLVNKKYLQTILKWTDFNKWPYDMNFDKRTNLLAEYIHKSFIMDYKSKKWLLGKNTELDPTIKDHRMSFNFVSWFGEMFREFIPQIDSNVEDEIFFNTMLPVKVPDLQNCIYGNLVVSHYAYSTQVEYLDKQLVLKEYRGLRNEIFGTVTHREENINQEDGNFKSLNREEQVVYLNMSAPRKKAIFTIVKNEDRFLRLWLRYYSQFFDNEDIYVLDHQTNDGSTENLKCWKLKVNHEYGYDFNFLIQTAQDFQYELLKHYRNVIYTDVDEFLVLSDKYKNFDDYFSKFKADYIRATGYEIFHNPLQEDPLDWSELILKQRSQWFRKQMYDKPIISTVPLQWGWGFHDVYNKKYKRDDDVFLIHLHRVDYEYCKIKHERTASYKWNPVQIQKHPTAGWHLRIEGKKEFDDFYYNKLENSGPIEPIPNWIKEKNIL